MKLDIYNWGYAEIFSLSYLKYDIEIKSLNELLIYTR